jgi:hypothetical protein
VEGERGPALLRGAAFLATTSRTGSTRSSVLAIGNNHDHAQGPNQPWVERIVLFDLNEAHQIPWLVAIGCFYLNLNFEEKTVGLFRVRDDCA